MEQDPACTRSLRSLTAASSPARRKSKGLQERQEAWSFWDLSLRGPQLVSLGSQSP